MSLRVAVALFLLACTSCTRTDPERERAAQKVGEAARASTASVTTPSTESVALSGSHADVRIRKHPFRITVRNPNTGSEILTGTDAASIWYERGEKRHVLERVLHTESEGDRLRLWVDSDDAEPTVVTVRRESDRTIEFTVTPPTDAGPPSALGASWKSPGDEAFYGLTERLRDSELVGWGEVGLPYDELFPPEVGSLDRRGEQIEMFVRPTIAVYAPFYHSSRGYGLAVDGALPGMFDLAATEPDVAAFRFETGTTRESRQLRFRVFAGPEHADIIDEYTRFTGRPAAVPSWAFLPWRWRGELEHGPPATLDGVSMNAQLVEDVTMHEKYDIPAGVYLLDRPVFEGEYGFARPAWDTERLPNFSKSLEALRKRGYRIVLWSSTWMCGDADHDNGKAATERGFLAPGRDRAECSDAGGTVLDVTNAEAYAWWRDRLAGFLAAEQIDGIKLDRGEEYIPSSRDDVWADRRHGREVHNDYVILQTKLHHDALRAAHPDGDFVLAARAGYAGTQAHAIVWAGDITGSEALGMWSGTDLGLRSAIIAQLRSAFLGFPVWGSDTGGYYEFKDREVFARWLAFSAFSGMMEIGGVGPHAPWHMPTDPEVDSELIEIYRLYSTIRVRLVDYIAAAAAEAAQTGMPIARPMVFYDRADPELRDMWDQYLFGPDLLVAPVWRSGQREREVYLPKGAWRDWWDPAKTYEGPKRVTVDAPLGRIPVFVRGDADVPTPPRNPTGDGT